MIIGGLGRQTQTHPRVTPIKIIIIVHIGTALYTKREIGVGRTPPPFGALASLHSVELASLVLVRPHASLSLIVGGARILVEFAFAPPPPRATANRENRNAWHWSRRPRLHNGRARNHTSSSPPASSSSLRSPVPSSLSYFSMWSENNSFKVVAKSEWYN